VNICNNNKNIDDDNSATCFKMGTDVNNKKSKL
jgi:hypothetical protein